MRAVHRLPRLARSQAMPFALPRSRPPGRDATPPFSAGPTATAIKQDSPAGRDTMPKAASEKPGGDKCGPRRAAARRGTTGKRHRPHEPPESTGRLINKSCYLAQTYVLSDPSPLPCPRRVDGGPRVCHTVGCRCFRHLPPSASGAESDNPMVWEQIGRLAQLVRAPARQAGGRRFEPSTAH